MTSTPSDPPGGPIAVVIEQRAPVGVQCLTQPRDVRLQRLQRCGRRARSPKIVDQPVSRDDLIGVQQQNRQQRPLLVATEPDRAIPIADLQRTENPKIHAPFLALPSARLPPLTAPDQPRKSRRVNGRHRFVAALSPAPLTVPGELGHQCRAIDTGEPDGKPTHNTRGIRTSPPRPPGTTTASSRGIREWWRQRRAEHRRRVIVHWLRRTANRAEEPHPIARRRQPLLHYRAAAVRTELLEIAAALERAQNPDPAAVATLRELLANGCDSPLYNPDIHVSELHATLHHVRAGLGADAAPPAAIHKTAARHAPPAAETSHGRMLDPDASA